MTFRQMLPFLLLNVIVSAAVVLGILFWWDSRQPEEAPAAAAAVATIAPALPTSAEVLPAPAGETDETISESADEPPTHVVQAGETLGIISNTYDVSLDDLMEANGLTNPDLISVGQQLIIPVGGIAEPTPTIEVTVALPTPIPTEQAVAEGAAEIEVAGVEGVGTLDEEVIQIVNSGTAEQAMLNWKIRDEDGNVYTFGQTSIFGEGAGIRLHTATGSNGPADLYWGLTEPAWRSGEVLTLWNADDQVIARFTVP
ncbi:MAG: LysM peptidoglycan-binding domain-containing protein [Chloroflexota bacterium]